MALETRDEVLGLVADGDVVGLRALLAREPAAVGWRDERGWTPLLHATAAGEASFALVEVLLRAGARADHVAEDGWTALHALSLCDADGRERLVAPLLAAGAPLEAVTPWGWTPLTAAVVEVDLPLVAALLAAGADPDVRFSPRAYPVFCRGWRLLHFALVQPDGPVLVEALLDAGADPGRTNGEGATPLALAERMLAEPEDDMDAAFLADVEVCRRLLLRP